MQAPFESPVQLKKQFNQGLHRLAEKQQMGTFILCLANASHDAELFTQLKASLKTQYLSLMDQYQAAMQGGTEFDVVDEDLIVFLKLQALGFDNIQKTQIRTESDWLCQFNMLRSFRPRRLTEFKHTGEMHTPFLQTRFHFNKPFMKNECFWSGDFNGKPLDLFYNKYPFANLHGLIVPEREACKPQLLDQDMHDYIWQLTRQLAETIPGIAHGYNSYGAYASVNHLHFQMFVDTQGLPISRANWKHNNGEDIYPLTIFKSKDMRQAWQIIKGLHAKKQPYNLLYMPDEIYILPRKVQGSVDVPSWSSGFTWYELSGAILLFDQHDYNKLQADEIYELLNRLSV